MEYKSSNFIEAIITKLSFFVLFNIVTSSVLSILNKFNYYIYFFICLFILLTIDICFLVVQNKKINFSKKDICVIIFVLLFFLINQYFNYPIFGLLRDYAIYAQGALLIPKYKGIIFDSENIGPGLTRSPLTGFVTLEQPIGYSSFLSIFNVFFGLKGIFWGNLPLIFLSASLLYFLIKKIGGIKASYIAIIFFVTNYTTIYFSRLTLSENLLLFLFVFGIYLFISAIVDKEDKLSLAAFLPITMLLFARAEGLLYFLSFFLTSMILIYFKKIDIKEIVKDNISILALIFSLLILFVLYFILFAPISYYQLFLAPINQLKQIFNTISNDLIFVGSKAIQGAQSYPFFKDFVFLLLVLILYNIFPFIIFAFFSFCKNRKNLIIKVILLLLSPSFLYLFFITIAPDHPWMLRRYWPTIFPGSLVLSSFLLEDLLNKNKFLFVRWILCLLIIPNLFFGSRIFFQRLGVEESKQLSGFIDQIENKNFLIFSPSYENDLARYFLPLKEILNLKANWPIISRPSDGEVFNNEIAVAIDLQKKIVDFKKGAIIITNKEYETGKQNDWLSSIKSVFFSNGANSLNIHKLSFVLEDVFRLPEYRVSLPPFIKETNKEDFIILKFE